MWCRTVFDHCGVMWSKVWRVRTAGDTSAASIGGMLCANHRAVTGACARPRGARGRSRSGGLSVQSDLPWRKSVNSITTSVHYVEGKGDTLRGMNTAGFALLLQPDGWDLLNSLPPYDKSTSLSLGAQLREQGHSADLVAAALTQSRLRALGEAKFGPFAANMLFTQVGLEQATRLSVAAVHAARFRDAGVPHVWDLGCGVGGDAMALAGLDVPVTAVDRDEVTVGAALMNLRHWPNATVRHECVESLEIPAEHGVYLDPARRSGSKKVFDPRLYSPGWDFVLAVSSRCVAAGIKVAPAISHDDLPDGVETQWVSVDGAVVEACIWRGATQRPGVSRSALLLSSDPLASSYCLDSADADFEQAPAGTVGEYLFEPDGAVIRSGLVAQVVQEIQGRLLDERIAYITTDSPVQHPAVTGYRVVEQLPLNVKRLQAYCGQHDIGAVTIKKRGVKMTPEELRKKLKLSGPNSATIVLTRIKDKHTAFIVTPLHPTNSPK